MTANTPRPKVPRYKGAELDPARGPGLGCFWLQVALLIVFVILTPLSVGRVGPEVSALLLLIVIVLLFFVGQTMIFLLRLVAAERRGRRRPVASTSRTAGELSDAERGSEQRPSDASGPTGEGPVNRGG